MSLRPAFELLKDYERRSLSHAPGSPVAASGGADLPLQDDGPLFADGASRGLGHEFRTSSDTEVIVHAWEQWGEDCFRRFNGQWAIGLWDRRERRLILSRDRLGVRPLYYTLRGHRGCLICRRASDRRRSAK